VKKENRYYYFGYGLNTNKSSMAQRCPDALSLGSSALFDWQFRFAYHADVVRTPGAKVSGVLWSITERCLESLDRLEGYPTYYERCIVPVVHNNQVYDSLVYYMTPGNADCPPPEYYWQMLQTGYREHGVTQRQLWQALEKSYTVEQRADPNAQVSDKHTTIVH
jgi:gamma-glutamylcyclotransferase (GGCT)/AIG2-like uncharacterized protein YtfP